MTLEESREVIPMMETMINQIEEQQNLMAEMIQELQERDRQLLFFQEQNQSLKNLNSELRDAGIPSMPLPRPMTIHGMPCDSKSSMS